MDREPFRLRSGEGRGDECRRRCAGELRAHACAFVDTQKGKFAGENDAKENYDLEVNE